MADPSQPERYTIVVEAMPADVPPIVRLRRLLKDLRRGYRMRCVAVTPARVDAIVESPLGDGRRHSGDAPDRATP
jgi:hypothetical protein